MAEEINGSVDVTTTIGQRGGVAVIVQTRTVSVTAINGDERRTELRVIETEKPLLPILEKRYEEQQRRTERELFVGSALDALRFRPNYVRQPSSRPLPYDRFDGNEQARAAEFAADFHRDMYGD